MHEVRVGVDIQGISEVVRTSRALRHMIFTKREREHAALRPDQWASLSALFAAKESFLKAADGLPRQKQLTFKEIEVDHASSGRPFLNLPSAFVIVAGITKSNLSLSHSDGVAVAVTLLMIA